MNSDPNHETERQIPRFTRNVERRYETWDYGTRAGVAAIVTHPSNGETLIRHAVTYTTQVQVREPQYSEPQKVYIDLSAGELPPPEPRPEWDDSEPGPDLPVTLKTLYQDADGVFYWTDREVIDYGESRELTPNEKLQARIEANCKLDQWLESVYQAGLALGEGRITGSVK